MLPKPSSHSDLPAFLGPYGSQVVPEVKSWLGSQSVKNATTKSVINWTFWVVWRDSRIRRGDVRQDLDTIRGNKYSKFKFSAIWTLTLARLDIAYSGGWSLYKPFLCRNNDWQSGILRCFEAYFKKKISWQHYYLF